MGLHGQGALSLNVNAKDGDTIGGQEDFKVTVQSAQQINQVEFYVGDELRSTETSTPYTFPLDTVDMSDGDLTVRFKAYTIQNKTAEKTLKLHIDNQKSKGLTSTFRLLKTTSLTASSKRRSPKAGSR